MVPLFHVLTYELELTILSNKLRDPLTGLATDQMNPPETSLFNFMLCILPRGPCPFSLICGFSFDALPRYMSRRST